METIPKIRVPLVLDNGHPWHTNNEFWNRQDPSTSPARIVLTVTTMRILGVCFLPHALLDRTKLWRFNRKPRASSAFGQNHAQSYRNNKLTDILHSPDGLTEWKRNSVLICCIGFTIQLKNASDHVSLFGITIPFIIATWKWRILWLWQMLLSHFSHAQLVKVSLSLSFRFQWW